MKPAGRRDGARMSSVDGLISLPVQFYSAPSASDVMGQRRFSERLELFVKIPG